VALGTEQVLLLVLALVVETADLVVVERTGAETPIVLAQD
jgi:hypothetical protein